MYTFCSFSICSACLPLSAVNPVCRSCPCCQDLGGNLFSVSRSQSKSSKVPWSRRAQNFQEPFLLHSTRSISFFFWGPCMQNSAKLHAIFTGIGNACQLCYVTSTYLSVLREGDTKFSKKILGARMYHLHFLLSVHLHVSLKFKKIDRIWKLPVQGIMVKYR